MLQRLRARIRLPQGRDSEHQVGPGGPEGERVAVARDEDGSPDDVAVAGGGGGAVRHSPALRLSVRDPGEDQGQGYAEPERSLGDRLSDVAQRYGLSRKQLSAWRTLARRGKLVLPCSTGPEGEPVGVTSEPGPEPAFATLEVDPAPEPDCGSLGSVSIEARGVTVRLDGEIGAGRLAEIASPISRAPMRRTAPGAIVPVRDPGRRGWPGAGEFRPAS